MRILVTKVNWLGDTVSFLPTLAELRRAMPAADITFLCSPVGEEVVRGCVDRLEVAVVEKAKVRSPRAALPVLWRTARTLRSRAFDVSLHAYDDPSFCYLLASALRVPRRLGFDGRIARAGAFLTERIPLDRARNVVDINLDLVRHLTGDTGLVPTRVALFHGVDEKARLDASLDHCGLLSGARFIALHGGAKLGYKEWASDRFLELATAIEARLAIPAVIIDDGSGRFDRWPRLVRTPTLADLACLLERAHIFVGNNSGPMHVASAMGTPCVVVQGPSPHNWEVFWPDLPHRTVTSDELSCSPCESLDEMPGRCLRSSRRNGCLEAISVSRVRLAVEQLAASMPPGWVGFHRQASPKGSLS